MSSWSSLGPVLAAETSEAAVRAPYGVIAAAGGAALVLFLLYNYLARSGTIARATIKEALRQPVFILLAIIGSLVIMANYWVPFFTLGDDTRVFIDCGLQTILISSLLLAVWTASISVADEIEGKTAMTLLSKPINRRQFVLGKYMGILQGALLLTALLGIVLIVATYFKYGYDQKESGQQVAAYLNWNGWVPLLVPDRFEAAATILPALALIVFEVAAMTAVSVAISTRAPMLVNMVTCFAIFVIGHLTPVLVATSFEGGALVFVQFVAQLLALVLPTLDHFNMSTAVSTGAVIPGDYLLTTGLYCLAYSAAVVLLAFILFEDRDLA
jgi:ABC-type transport system involved in multi-copper enzyme maturation permease subunit